MLLLVGMCTGAGLPGPESREDPEEGAGENRCAKPYQLLPFKFFSFVYFFVSIIQ